MHRYQRLIVDLFHCKQRISYARGQEIQSYFIQQILPKMDRGILLLFEFQPVYTCGIRRSSSIINSDHIERLRSLGADFYETDRGGLLTFHGPGQLVAYPLLPLQNRLLSLTLRTYIDRLEQTLVETCRRIIEPSRVHSGVGNGRSVNYAGAWIDNQRKVAFMGVRYSRGITSHGISINCSVDMNWFNHIIPCGFDHRQITSLTDEMIPKQKITLEKITGPFLDSFQSSFNVDLNEMKDNNLITG